MVRRAATDELTIHEETDRVDREAAATRADRLPAVQRLFGARLAVVQGEEDVG